MFDYVVKHLFLYDVSYRLRGTYITGVFNDANVMLKHGYLLIKIMHYGGNLQLYAVFTTRILIT